MDRQVDYFRYLAFQSVRTWIFRGLGLSIWEGTYEPKGDLVCKAFLPTSRASDFSSGRLCTLCTSLLSGISRTVPFPRLKSEKDSTTRDVKSSFEEKFVTVSRVPKLDLVGTVPLTLPPMGYRMLWLPWGGGLRGPP